VKNNCVGINNEDLNGILRLKYRET